MTVTLIWNEQAHQWFVLDSSGFFVFHLYDCHNTHRIFPGLNRLMENRYTLTVKPMKKKGK